MLLAGDIDRGGVFAQIVGTIELLEEQERRRIKGTIINKFRGDKEILRPGLDMAEMVDAPVLLAGDIDRGGVFAQIVGTIELLEEQERRRIKGTIINKFRGDKEILRPGLDMLEEKTKIPVCGVVPYFHLDIDEEDSLSERFTHRDVCPDCGNH